MGAYLASFFENIVLYYDALSQVAKIQHILESLYLEFSMIFNKNRFYSRHWIAGRNSLFTSCGVNISTEKTRFSWMLQVNVPFCVPSTLLRWKLKSSIYTHDFKMKHHDSVLLRLYLLQL